jgi:hypothetical protein
MDALAGETPALQLSIAIDFFTGSPRPQRS